MELDTRRVSELHRVQPAPLFFLVRVVWTILNYTVNVLTDSLACTHTEGHTYCHIHSQRWMKRETGGADDTKKKKKERQKSK